MKSKKILALMAIVMLLSLLAGCKSNLPPAPAVLRVWIQWGDNPAQLQELFNGFGEKYGVTVEVTAPLEEDKILTTLSGSNPPDILVLSGGDFLKSYAAEGYVEPLNDIIASNHIEINDIYQAPLDQCKSGDTYLCLPWGTDMYALFWNKDLFEAAGLDPNRPPQTMEELVQYNDLLTTYDADGNITQIGFVPDYAWGHLDLYVRMFGGFWYSDDGSQLTVNSQAMIDALTWEQQFYTTPGIDKVTTFMAPLGNYAASDFGFYTGKVAMFVDGEWEVGPNFIQSLAPTLNYGVAAFPPPADHPERANTAVVQGTVVMIPSGAANKEWSGKLLAWMESAQVLADEMYVNANLPTSKSAAADPRFAEIPNFNVFMNLMADPNAKYVITTPISLSLVNDELANVEEQVLRNNGDPKTLLDASQAKYLPIFQEAMSK
jgi:multiple sugar transport system substrate-binding protein